MNTYETLRMLEDDDTYHLARLILIIGVFSGQAGNGSIDGLTKLAKLDFLLRYPTNLARALKARGVDTSEAKVSTQEQIAVESRMIRYRYGPWDFRYRRWLSMLSALRLIHVFLDGRTIKICMAEEGLEYFKKLSSLKEYEDMLSRAKLLRRHFNFKARKLMEFIYEVFPELSNMRYGEEIENGIQH